MRNIYNKGRFRNGEWAKHLRPFLKKTGNRRWRTEAKSQISSELHDDSNSPITEEEFPKKKSPRKFKKKIKVKITFSGHHGELISVEKKYDSVKKMRDATNRNNVLRFHVYGNAKG